MRSVVVWISLSAQYLHTVNVQPNFSKVYFSFYMYARVGV